MTATYNIKALKRLDAMHSPKLTIAVGEVKVKQIELVYNEQGEVISMNVEYDTL